MNCLFSKLTAASVLLAGVALIGSPAAAQQAVMKECGEKWQAAKAANKTGDQTWPQFLSKCRADAAKAGEKPAAATPAVATPAKPAAPSKPAVSASPAAPAKPATSAVGTAAAGAFVFPRAINAKYASEKPGQQRMKTCLDQYNANKASGKGNGGKNWIEKGGGYYSECNKRLGGGTAAKTGG